MWYWRAPSLEPAQAESVIAFDATGSNARPAPRDDAAPLGAEGRWSDGQWRVMFTRPLVTEDPRDLGFEPGRYIPISFANWDGWAGQSGGRHTLTAWYWLLLVPKGRPLVVYGSAVASAVVMGLVFLAVARRARRRYSEMEPADRPRDFWPGS
jgi:hypothetical protein